MSETKLKIIKQALLLFNNNGTANVSLRAIAKETGISIGNLQYHFKKREDIIEALYFQLVDKIDAEKLTKASEKRLINVMILLSYVRF